MDLKSQKKLRLAKMNIVSLLAYSVVLAFGLAGCVATAIKPNSQMDGEMRNEFVDTSEVFYAKVNDYGALSYITTNNEILEYDICSFTTKGFSETFINEKIDTKKRCLNSSDTKKANAIASSAQFQNFAKINKHSFLLNEMDGFSCTYALSSMGDGADKVLCNGSHVFYSASIGNSVGITAGMNLVGIALTPLGGLGLAYIGTITSYDFNQEKYKKFIDMYGLEKNKNNLFSDLESTKTTKFVACDISTYEAKDYTSITPETACKHLPNEGLFIYRTAKGMFSDNKGDGIGLFGVDELREPLKVTQKITQRMIEHYMDVVSLHPEIPLPKTLPQLILEKSQFEKEADFQKRKSQVLSQREEEQKELNEAYISAVKKRNLSIFEELENRKALVKNKIVEFRKQAFMAVATPPNFAFKNYDAENEKLYGEFSFGDNMYRVVSMNVDPKIAQKVHDKTVTLTPQANYEMIQSGDSATFQTKELMLLAGSDKLKFEYTDNRYQPPSMKLVIPSYDISAFQDGIADATKEATTISSTALKALQDLERYRVKSQLTISDTAIHRVNAKTPTWYENPNCGQDKCAVGRGETQSEALKVALAQLGCILKSSIVSELVVEKTVTDDIAELKKTSYTIQQSCSNTLDDGSMNITNQAELDGWYYIRTVLDNKI